LCALAAEVADQLGQCWRAPDLSIAISANYHHPSVAELARDKPQHQQRGLVGIVEVIEHDHQGVGGGQVSQQMRSGIEQPKARLLGVW
jgi:hypothetical protein